MQKGSRPWRGLLGLKTILGSQRIQGRNTFSVRESSGRSRTSSASSAGQLSARPGAAHETHVTAPSSVEDREPFDRLLGELRLKLHRYCARMTGSAIDADDVVQEVSVKALEARLGHGPIANIEG
jgi:hypothetical protein